MPQCIATEPELYAVDETQVRCLLYAERAEPAAAR
jgi:hypothetical protein